MKTKKNKLMAAQIILERAEILKKIKQTESEIQKIEAKKRQNILWPIMHIVRSFPVIHLLCNKRTIFCTLADKSGQIKASVSTGILKVKGKKRKGFHLIPKTSQRLINHIFKIKEKTFLIEIKGNGPKKKKRFLIKTFFKIKRFKFAGLKNLTPRSHNGCRPPKKRRK